VPDISSRLASIRSRVALAIARRGPRHPSTPEVELIGVSKRQPIEAIRVAHASGLTNFGESYAQEFREKTANLEGLGIRWHFIGHLQSNKAKYVTGRCLVHAVDSRSTLASLAKRALSADLTQEVLVEVNLGEPQKPGVPAAQMAPFLDLFADFPSLRCVGLMVIPPAGAPEKSRQHFTAMRKLQDNLRANERQHVDLRHLSMGMSSDFEIAIEEGATLVRVGTGIFGPRPPEVRSALPRSPAKRTRLG